MEFPVTRLTRDDSIDIWMRGTYGSNEALARALVWDGIYFFTLSPLRRIGVLFLLEACLPASRIENSEILAKHQTTPCTFLTAPRHCLSKAFLRSTQQSGKELLRTVSRSSPRSLQPQREHNTAFQKPLAFAVVHPLSLPEVLKER